MSTQPPTAPALTNIRIIEDGEGIAAITCGSCSHLHDGGDGLTVRALTVEGDLSRRSPAACPECSTALDWRAPVAQDWAPYVGQGPEAWEQIVTAMSDTITQIADDV